MSHSFIQPDSPVSSFAGSIESDSNVVSSLPSSAPNPLPLTTKTHPMLTRSKNSNFKPKVFAVQTDYSCTEPHSYSIASKYPY